MKRTFFAFVALFLISGAVSAQNSTPEQNKDKATTQVASRVHDVDHLLFITGKVYRSQQGQLTAIEGQIRLENGLLVNPNGTYQMPEQRRRRLQEGECLDMAGNLYANLVEFDNNRIIRQASKDKSALKNANKAAEEATQKDAGR